MEMNEHMEAVDVMFNWSSTTTDVEKFQLDSMVGMAIANMMIRLLTVFGSIFHLAIWTLVECTGLQLVMVASTMTAMVCLFWYVHVNKSHLCCGKRLQCRLERKKSTRTTNQLKKQLLAAIILCGMSNAHAMEEQATMQEAFLQRMTSMAEAATRAAVAAEEALKKASTSGGVSSNEGLQAASRILKPPDTFNGDDVMAFQQWKHQFTSWLCFGDTRYQEALDLLEKRETAPEFATYNSDERAMSSKLYAVLTSYLRGKCAHIVRAEAHAKDGFKLWYTLNQEFMPSTRQRSLALAQALGSYPAFSKDRSVLESILNYEQLVLEYEQASGSKYPKELMSATLIKCCNPKLREQIQLSITDSTSYIDIREKITSYERVSKAWTE